jgi:hypothetical protein
MLHQLLKEQLLHCFPIHRLSVFHEGVIKNLNHSSFLLALSYAPQDAFLDLGQYEASRKEIHLRVDKRWLNAVRSRALFFV